MCKVLRCLVLLAASIWEVTSHEGHNHSDTDQNCGRSKIVMPRITGSTPADKNDFPWLVGLVLGDGSTCSATIISDEWLITAAHCVINIADSPENVIGVPGILSNDVPMTIIFKRIVIHPDFVMDNRVKNITTLYNGDYALLQTMEKLDFSNNAAVMLKPICLLESCSREVEIGTLCIVAGWGSNRRVFNPTNSTVDETMHKMVSPLVRKETCQNAYDAVMQNNSKSSFGITENMACFGFNGDAVFDSCQGDGGAPIICRNPETNSYYLHGIDGFAVGCVSRFGNYRVYFKPCSVIDWIQDVTQPRYNVPAHSSVTTGETTLRTQSTPLERRRILTRPAKSTTVAADTTTQEATTATTTGEGTTNGGTVMTSETTVTSETTTTSETTFSTTKASTLRRRLSTTKKTPSIPPPTTNRPNIPIAVTTSRSSPTVRCGQLPQRAAVAPWVAVIAYGDAKRYDGFLQIRCAAAVLSPRWLLTSKSCFSQFVPRQTPNGVEAFVVGSSSFDRTQLRPSSGVAMKAYANHPYKNVAIVKLSRDLFPEDNSVCLPVKPEFPTNCVVLGWSDSRTRQCSQVSTKTAYIDSQAEEPIELVDVNNGTYPMELVTLTEPLYFCKEDVGGPLACAGPNNKYSLYGIISARTLDDKYVIIEPICNVKPWIREMVDFINRWSNITTAESGYFDSNDSSSDQCLALRQG